MSHVSVNNWVNRYKTEDISGLSIRPGRGKKSLLNLQEDKDLILESVKRHRQKVSSAKAEWEASNEKKSKRKNLSPLFKKLGRRYKRIRKRCKGRPLYVSKKLDLQELEKLEGMGLIDLFLGR